jgi:diguanylate cyclase (GGDEF)-like protein/PAS domain S-box-containing protein
MRETGEAARIKACLAGKPAEPREIDYAAPDADRPSVFESLVAPLQGPRGQALGAVVRVRDVTEHRRAEEKLRRAMVTIDAEGRITDANEAAVSGTGVPRESLIGSRFADYFTDPAEARAAHEEAFAKGIVRNVPLTLRHASGKATDVLYNASVYRDDRGGTAGVLAVARDITERKRAEQAEALARRDSLTGLCNHRTFYDLLEGETVRARRFKRPVSVLMLDIDYFKRVNDTDGHQAGDMILRKLGDLLLRRARAVDHVCRYGGEEFALILPETDTQAGAEIAERLRDDIERERFIVNGGKPVAITVSIGVATYPQQAVTAEELIRAADVALYEAKHGGRNRVVRCAAERPS